MPVVEMVAMFGMRTAVVTDNNTPLLTERVEPFPTEIEFAVRSLLTVRVNPAPITMSSVVAGITPPGQGAFGVVELQLPEPVVVMVAAHEE